MENFYVSNTFFIFGYTILPLSFFYFSNLSNFNFLGLQMQIKREYEVHL
jgi:hypothetical protein